MTPQIIQETRFAADDVTPAVVFHWIPPKDDGMVNIMGDLTYKIKYCLFNNRTKTLCQYVTTTDTSFDVRHVQQNSIYVFSVTPVNKASQNGPTKTVFYRTGEWPEFPFKLYFTELVGLVG